MIQFILDYPLLSCILSIPFWSIGFAIGSYQKRKARKNRND